MHRKCMHEVKSVVILGHVTNDVILKVGIACRDASVVLTVVLPFLHPIALPWNIPNASLGGGGGNRRNCYGLYVFTTVEITVSVRPP